MLGRDEQMQPGFVDFQNFSQGFGFARREASFRDSKKPTRWDFARTVTQRWLEKLKFLTILLIPLEICNF